MDTAIPIAKKILHELSLANEKRDHPSVDTEGSFP